MYQEFSGRKRQQELEERVLERWKSEKVFERSLKRRENAKPFTFFEGPPTANGRPGIHHVLSRSLKDIVCRYQDLIGHRVERKAGWDTHGLPVEVEVEKSLDIHGKEAIAEYGVERFTRKCIDSVFTYTEEWEKLTDRIGYWLDMKSPYVTFHEDYVESVWWALAELYKKGHLYHGHKVVWWWPEGGTALSSAEVGLGYREVEDPSVTIRFPWKDGLLGGKPTSFLAWTTTPWTLPSHVALAVGEDLEYGAYDLGDEVVICATDLAESVLKAHENPEQVATFRGAELLGKAYEPPFRFKEPEDGKAYIVIDADFVTTSSGTGLVHLAPGFGEDDARVCREKGMGFLQLVAPDGTMAEEVTDWAGQYIKDADKPITRNLKDRGLLFTSTRYKHDYPFCWRASSDPLIQYARGSWFVRTTAVKDRMLELNNEVNWHPDHLQQGRFGDFLRKNVDWALSRERFWGTPLPIWINDTTGTVDVISSVEELLERAPDAFKAFDAAREKDPEMPVHLRLHKPWIDDVTWQKAGEDGTYRRVPEVIDCWFDSGAMPFAQRHWPFERDEVFKKSHPADFICEGIDQTRGWFYSLLAISTLLFDKAPYRNVMVNGHVNDKDGRKMSKSQGNAVNAWDVIERYGVDPLRWNLVAGSPPWLSKNFDEDGVSETHRKVFGTLWPSYNFFAMYASIDGWRPGRKAPPVAERCAMDRWLLSRTHSVLRNFRAAMDSYDLMKATRLAGEFLVEELSNWYIRRSRVRFWKSRDEDDKAAAYDTLFHALETVAFVMAPIAPLSADALYLALHPEGDALDSIHLGDMPSVDESLIDADLEARMEAVLNLASLARAARETAAIKVRQPLPRLVVTGPDRDVLEAICGEEFARELKEEINVKELEAAARSGEYCNLTLKPNLPILGPRLGKNLGALKKRLGALTEEEIAVFETTGTLKLDLDGLEIALGNEELLVERQGREGFAVAAANGWMAALDTQLDDALIQEGLARELINRVQNQRKQSGLEVTQRVHLHLAVDGAIRTAVETHRERIANEVLATKVVLLDPGAEGPNTTGQPWQVNDHKVTVYLVTNEV